MKTATQHKHEDTNMRQEVNPKTEEDGHQIKRNERVVNASLPKHPCPILTTTIKTAKQLNHKTGLT